MKKNIIILTLVLVILCSVFVSIFFYTNLYIKEVYYLDMDLVVKNNIGVNADSDAIHFGGVPPGGKSMRKTIIKNNFSHPVLVSIKTYGDLQDSVSVSDNNFYLAKNSTKIITFLASIKEGTEIGKYFGKAKIEFKRPLSTFI
ncbi:hypothetical protein GF327_10130 [Candidatus Woesearchaeota archaeon]|nr:hypothetical protein [Candidatus Woesearchaeota archaeon]